MGGPTYKPPADKLPGAAENGALLNKDGKSQFYLSTDNSTASLYYLVNMDIY
ncbi:hypothetical protein HMSSN036_53300 [Paenibacillus macerans]|uniref:hypothetical protein n=1 Tax=Paenibacillus sp. FSL R5-0527 TaxID=2975321 RepID=UPI00207DCA9E|nr:hypothetical protein HMSSN036_53300 [Paenibacillus macerans]